MTENYRPMLALLLYVIRVDRKENTAMMRFLSQPTSTENETIVIYFLIVI